MNRACREEREIKNSWQISSIVMGSVICLFIYASISDRRSFIGSFASGKQCFMADFFIKLHKKQKRFLKIADHKRPGIIRIRKTFNKKFPEDLLQFTGTVKRTIENMKRFALVDIKNSSQVRTGCVNIYICFFTVIQNQIMGLKRKGSR